MLIREMNYQWWNEFSWARCGKCDLDSLRGETALQLTISVLVPIKNQRREREKLEVGGKGAGPGNQRLYAVCIEVSPFHTVQAPCARIQITISYSPSRVEGRRVCPWLRSLGGSIRTSMLKFE